VTKLRGRVLCDKVVCVCHKTKFCVKEMCDKVV